MRTSRKTPRKDAGHTRCLHPMDDATKAQCAAQAAEWDAMWRGMK